MKKYFLLAILVLTFQLSPLVGIALAEPMVAMYDSKEFVQEKETFSPYDKIFVLITFPSLAKGEYSLTADWVTPWGDLNRQDVHSFSIKGDTAPYRAFFWMQLKRKSSLKRTLTGSDFKEEFFGEWQIRMFLNGEALKRQTFSVH